MSKKLRNIDFIKKAEKIHDNKYNYSLVDYKTAKIKIKILCPKHGAFNQEPRHHLSGCGCLLCSKEKDKGNIKKTTSLFIEEAKKVHGNRYDYSLVDYVNNKTNVKIMCVEHGIFEQKPISHLTTSGCTRCSKKIKYTIEDFIKMAKATHGDKYDYTPSMYEAKYKKISIVCKKHGVFKQKPEAHIEQKQGCPRCRESKGEREVAKILDGLNIKYERQYTFQECRNKNVLPFDFYLLDHDTCVEFDGSQHFRDNYFGGKVGLLYRQQNDKIKNEFCITQNIKLIRIKYSENIQKMLETIFG